MAAALKTVRDRYTDVEIAAYYYAGSWQPTSFNQLLAEQARAQPDDTFVFDSTTSISYAAMHERALRLAVGLKRAGLTAGDRIAVQLPNWTEFPLIAAAANRIGVVLVPIMPIYRGDEVGFVLRHSGARAVITCGEFRGFDHHAMMRSLLAEAPEVENLYVARGTGADSLAALEVGGDLAALAAEAGPDASPDDPFLIVYTSGTTSRPKGCFHTFNTIRASAAAIRASLDYGRDDVQFGPSPVTHSTGLVTSVVLPLLVGASSYLMEVFEPGEALRRIEQHRLTAAVTATPFLQMLMQAYDPDQHDASSLRLWVCAGSPIPGSVVERSREMFAGCRTLSLYGRSENFLTTMCTVRDDEGRSITSDGSAVAGAEVKIVGTDGLEVPRGEEGDIAYRGPSHMIEYFHDDEETALLFTPEGFSRSGDLGRMDADGYVRVTGRLKDIVIRGGMNISARELEEHLLRHPGIANVAAVGMPDERLGEKVCVYVVLAPGAEPLELADVTAYLREHEVATQKLPERLELVPELPMTATGKIQKHLLRAQIAAQLESEVVPA
ncbi:AMP-binding protein [Nocardioides mangrovi]|uniref:AMP-binding protein n=1 Tax=Nocardioides mangrovi TaxID=2874580 RepID=A0ABS7UBX3_9ACTN|nr:AMP-binding protein [Nocardioides mangrovi]MBZ5738375.1 AMP-binding protein [Nocardioides mangrovi]